MLYALLGSEGDPFRWIKFGSKLGEFLVRLCVALEEIILTLPELLSEWSKASIVKKGFIRGQLKKLRVGLGVRHSQEIRVIENQPFLSPARSARGVRSL